MPEQKGIMLTGRGTLGYTVCLWAAVCNLEKTWLTQSYHLCSVTRPDHPDQPAVLMVLMKVLSRQKAESVPLKEVFFTKQWKKVMFMCQRKNKIIFSKAKESAHSVSLQEKRCPDLPTQVAFI